ncbi:MAG: hypothetical protein U1E65_29165 [Myxococcota bacterium]
MTTTRPSSRPRSAWIAAAAALSLASLAGCDSGTTLANVPPFISASTTTIDFGEVKVGHEEERTVYLINKGTQNLTLEQPTGDGLGGIFAILLDEYIAGANKSVVARVKFNPGDPMPYTTTMVIPNDSSNEKMLTLTLKGTGIMPGPCDEVDCTFAPRPFCVTSTLSRHSQPGGVCVNGTCQYQFREEGCQFGCDEGSGTCRMDPCLGMACNTPPSPCYFASGVCQNGACVYTPNNAGNCSDGTLCTSGDHCEEGNCVGTPVTCDAPPAPLCIPGNIRRVYDAQGTCTSSAGGGCTYASHDQPCQFACDPSGCGGDPCLGVSCNMPPGQCFDMAGTCSGGGCSYNPRVGACDDGDGCTQNDACTNGACSGSPVSCTTPPPADCAAMDVVRTYTANGSCTGGACQYPSMTRSCDDGNACTTGDSCSNGACVTTGILNCDDGNACTTDSCDPVVGCRHVPTSGNACTTGSGDCPTGMCSAGTCLATPNINCQASYDVCFGAFSVDVPGRCAASGQCVVTQPPPQFTCPGCNGLCIQCAFIQICVPF